MYLNFINIKGMIFIFRILILNADSFTKELIRSCIPTNKIKMNLLCFVSVQNLYETIKTQTIDFFIIDISSDQNRVLDAAVQIRKIDKYKYTPLIILSDNIDNYIFSFKYIHCYAFIIKPLQKCQLYSIFDFMEYYYNLITNSQAGRSEFIKIDLPNKFYKIPTEDIIFIESYDRKCKIHTYSGIIDVNYTFSKILGQIKSTSIIQSHRSYLINISNIRKIDKTINSWIIHFYNYETTALVSRNFRKDIQCYLEAE